MSAVKPILPTPVGKAGISHAQGMAAGPWPPVLGAVEFAAPASSFSAPAVLYQRMPTPAQVKKGSVLQVQADGADPESGVAQVVFFFGRPDKGEIPPAAPRFKAIPATRDRAFWMAALLIPADHKGPLAVSVQVVRVKALPVEIRPLTLQPFLNVGSMKSALPSPPAFAGAGY